VRPADHRRLRQGRLPGDRRRRLAPATSSTTSTARTPATGCVGNYVRWSRPSQDASSATTGSSIFDFEFDGQAEAVYGDECFTRVYEGKTGEVLYSSYRTSCTWYENPIVADVDNDRIAA
jgi:hypothetical protein